MGDVTQILSDIESGDQGAAEMLLPLVYDELRRLAAQKMLGEPPDHTLQATALVHEAFLRLVDATQALDWNSRGHFFGAAAEAMRRILINHARKTNTEKRGGERRKIELDLVHTGTDLPCEQLLELDEAIERLASEDESLAQLVKLRFFAGLSLKETAAALGIAPRSADRKWSYARAWLYDFLQQEH